MPGSNNNGYDQQYRGDARYNSRQPSGHRQQYHQQAVPTYQVSPAVVQQHYPQHQQQHRQQLQQQYQQIASSMPQQPADMYPVSEVVPVPDALSAWATGGHIQAVLLKVKEQSGVGYLTIDTDGAGKVSVLVHASSSDSASLARLLIEIHLKEEVKFLSDKDRLDKMQSDLFEVQGEVAAGQRVEFYIPLPLIGLSIGKGGQRIKDVTNETGVNNISIDGKSGQVKISGPSPASVQAAKEQMDVREEQVELTKEEAIAMLTDRSYLNDLKAMSKCIAARIPDHENHIILVGTKAAVASAKLVIDTQKGYISKRQHLKESASSIRDELRSLDRANKPYYRGGDARNNSRGGGGGRGGYKDRKVPAPDSLQNLQQDQKQNQSQKQNQGQSQSNASGDGKKKSNNKNSAKNDEPKAGSKSAPTSSAAPKKKAESGKTNDGSGATATTTAATTEGSGKAKTKAKAKSKATKTSTPDSVAEVTKEVSTLTVSDDQGSTKPKTKPKKKKTATATGTTAVTDSSSPPTTEEVNAIAAAIAKKSQPAVASKDSGGNKKRGTKASAGANSQLESLPTPPAKQQSVATDTAKSSTDDQSPPLPPRRAKKAANAKKSAAASQSTNQEVTTSSSAKGGDGGDNAKSKS
mmetsp:Transcript_10848/g.20056  ORF Transcript_10848/g.20056 Transcript_10848/m.20056 type:complete len:636 (+) Transcript_10848:44-1951(+)